MSVMRKSRAAVGLVITAAAISSVVALPNAVADTSPQVSQSPDPNRSALEQFKIDRDNYLNAMRIRGLQIRNINNDFKVACDTAASAFKSAMASARTPDQKNAAIAARKNAISAAIDARDNAIAALGAEPTPPVEPQKPMRGVKGKSR
jgi:hypothetical protein